VRVLTFTPSLYVVIPSEALSADEEPAVCCFDLAANSPCVSCLLAVAGLFILSASAKDSHDIKNSERDFLWAEFSPSFRWLLDREKG